ncbi:translation initiation factor IF-2-like [Corvus cornix cornix]|uniref:translation initiation factor IF-2-like n=1 Tax=Corvus cornix cornix TaxID=932674 RepID=UPI00194F5656|nr:translation initiation factor IF-2-like [Corvus cornix cornix]
MSRAGGAGRASRPSPGAPRARPAAAGGHPGARRRRQREGLGRCRRLPSGPRGGGCPGRRGAAGSGSRAAIPGPRSSASGSQGRPRARPAPAWPGSGPAAGAVPAARSPRRRAAVPGTKGPLPALRGVPIATAAAETPCPGLGHGQKAPRSGEAGRHLCGEGPRSALAMASNCSPGNGLGAGPKESTRQRPWRGPRVSRHWPIAYEKGGQETEESYSAPLLHSGSWQMTGSGGTPRRNWSGNGCLNSKPLEEGDGEKNSLGRKPKIYRGEVNA